MRSQMRISSTTVTSLMTVRVEINKNKVVEFVRFCKCTKRLCQESVNVVENETIDLRFRLLKQLGDISTRVDEILCEDELDIHQMADLLRYAQTYESLSVAYSNITRE